MKLYRNLNEQVRTDSKKPDGYVAEWKESGRIWLSGTKTASAMRATDLCLEIEEEDVVALFYGLVERYEEFWPDQETCGEVMSNDLRVTNLLGLCAQAITRLGSACHKAAI